jgi:Mor family transcriptional regulator
MPSWLWRNTQLQTQSQGAMMGDRADLLAELDADLDLPEAVERLMPADRWPAHLAEMTDIVASEISLAGVGEHPSDRRSLAHRIVARILQEYGGTVLYIPKTDSIHRALRDQSIWAGWSRGDRGVKAVARRYEISENQVYRIIRTQMALHIRAVQLDLFD